MLLAVWGQRFSPFNLELSVILGKQGFCLKFIEYKLISKVDHNQGMQLRKKVWQPEVISLQRVIINSLHLGLFGPI